MQQTNYGNSEDLKMKMNLKMKNLKINTLVFSTIISLLFVAVFSSQSAFAERGLVIEENEPNYSDFKNQDKVEDIRVKVLGGYVRMNRTWKGDHWAWNERWGDITQKKRENVQVGSGQMYLDGIVALNRSGQVYRRKLTSDGIVFENLEKQWIEQVSNGYEWENKNGDRIFYDKKGKMTHYMDRASVKVSVVRDVQGNIESIKDHFDQTVLTLEYEDVPGATPVVIEGQSYNPKRIKRIQDYAQREVVYQWNALNRLESVTDVRGQVWAYTYDAQGLLTQLKDPENKTTHYQIQKNGRLISRYNHDGVGERYSQHYDKTSETFYTSRTSSSGEIVETWKNSLGQKVKTMISGELQSETSFVLNNGATGVEPIRVLYTSDNSSGGYAVEIYRQLPVWVKYLKVKDVRGNVTTTELNSWGETVKVTYPDDTFEKTHWHNKWSLPLSYTDQKGIVTEYEYDNKGNLITLIEAKGTTDERTTRYTYDEYGQVKTETSGESIANNTVLATTEYDYDNLGNLIQIKDPENHITRFSDFDALGNAKTIIDARANLLAANAQYSWVLTYDNAGNFLTGTDPNAKQEIYTYNKNGDLQKIQLETGSSLTFVNNASGQPLSATDSNNKITQFAYDKANRLLNVTDANGNKTQLSYDAQGRLSKLIDAENNTIQYSYANNLFHKVQTPTSTEIFEYDNLNRIKQTTQQANSRNTIRKMGYDQNGNSTSSTDAQDKTTGYEYDSLNRVKKITDAEGGITEFTYDARDNLLQVKDPENRLTIYTYDKNDQMVTETKDGDQNTNRTRHYTYDPNGNLIQTLNPEQEKTVYEFDQANRLTTASVYAHKDHTKPIKIIRYQHNVKNQLSGWTQEVGTGLPEGVTPTADVIALSETYTYTALDQIESVTVNFGGFTKTYSYTYYPNGLKQTYVNPEGITYTYYYNKNNQLIAVHIPGNGQITYTDFNWLVPQTLLLPGGNKITLKYDDFLQVKERLLKNPDDQTLATALYEYDLEQNIKKIENRSGIFNFAYDDVYRLTQADYPTDYAANDETFDYDKVGNRVGRVETRVEGNVTETQTINAKNQLQTTNSSSDTDDASYTYNANGHTQTKTKNGETTEYIYNHEERLIAVKKNNILIAEYIYDPQGRRVKKTVSGVSTFYLYNENGLAAEYTDQGIFQKEYHFHPQATWMTAPQFMRTASNQVYYYHNDHLGTPQELIDREGNIVWQAEYDAFGKATIKVSSVENNLRFPGQYFDGETGLHHNYFRDFDFETGRYIQADPIGLIAGINIYSYVGQNPFNWFDPQGLFSIRDALGFVPIVGSLLDAYDAAKCGNWGMAALNLGLAILDATGVGALVKGAVVGGFKWSQRKAVRDAYNNSDNWPEMRKALQDAGVVPRNTGGRGKGSRADWITTDHVFIKQRKKAGHKKTNHPMNLLPGVPLPLNVKFETMKFRERVKYYPEWTKKAAILPASYGTGLAVGCGCEKRG
jgi:RHS repeat-associated protein